MNNLKKALKVPLKFHWTALLLPLLFVINSGPIGILYWAILIAGLLFHEYGHVYQALKEGVRVKYVSVFVLGGFAALESELIEPMKEIKIAVAGPLASLLLAALAIPIALISANEYVVWFILINILFCVFNLVPAYPMDGGRVLNGILSAKLGYRKGVHISTIVAYVIAGGGFIFSVNGMAWMAIVSAVVGLMAYGSKKAVDKRLDKLGYE